jgi:hypothetical protein
MLRSTHSLLINRSGISESLSTKGKGLIISVQFWGFGIIFCLEDFTYPAMVSDSALRKNNLRKFEF